MGMSASQRRRALEPLDRFSEVLFGLIMVLTVTCSFSVVGATPLEVRHMLLAALGCNVAWGVIDAVFYLLQRFGEQGRGIVALRALRKTTDTVEARAVSFPKRFRRFLPRLFPRPNSRRYGNG